MKYVYGAATAAVVVIILVLAVYKGPLRLLSKEDIQKESEKLQMLNSKQDFPKDLSYSKTIGIYNNRLVEAVYVCFGDVCPDNGGYFLRYSGAHSKEACEKIKGKPILGIGWSVVYGGCGIVLD